MLTRRLLCQAMVVAEEEVFVVIVEMHAVALAVLPHLTVGTLAPLRPGAVTELLEAVLPHFPEVILIYIALREVGTHAGTARDVAIDTYRGYTHTCVALKGIGAHTHLVAREEALTAICSLYASLLAAALDELHKRGKLLVAELQRGVGGSAAHGEDGEQAPASHAKRVKKLLELLEAR